MPFSSTSGRMWQSECESCDWFSLSCGSCDSTGLLQYNRVQVSGWIIIGPDLGRITLFCPCNSHSSNSHHPLLNLCPSILAVFSHKHKMRVLTILMILGLLRDQCTIYQKGKHFLPFCSSLKIVLLNFKKERIRCSGLFLFCRAVDAHSNCLFSLLLEPPLWLRCLQSFDYHSLLSMLLLQSN